MYIEWYYCVDQGEEETLSEKENVPEGKVEDTMKKFQNRWAKTPKNQWHWISYYMNP